MESSINLKECTIRPKIVVGQKIPDEIQFSFEGGGGWTNMASFRMDYLFKKNLKESFGVDYEFSDICRDENEKKALEMSISENCKSLGLNVVEYLD